MIKSLSSVLAEELEVVSGLKFGLTVDVDTSAVNAWTQQNAKHLKRLLNDNGAVLVRGLEIRGSKKLARVLHEIFDEKLLEYEFRSTPRTKKRGLVYTSSEYHPDETIFQHNENAYTNYWPLFIGFYCVTAAREGGATPIVDSRIVYQQIDPSIRREFESRDLLYVRNYGDVDLPWTEVFQTESKIDVQDYCLARNIDYEWINENQLRTKQRCRATQSHPSTNEKLWFNQAHLFHVSNLTEEHRANVMRIYTQEALPRNVYFGDGSNIPNEYLDHIRSVYQENLIAFDWQNHDLLLLDNMLYSHGRLPYKGDRCVLVGMANTVGSS